MNAEVTYKTHILIGVRENGIMSVIADWPHVPRQSEVEDRINGRSQRLRELRAVHADVHHACWS
jgi:hypothetical protein